MSVKKRVREIMNEIGPLTEKVHTPNEKMEKKSRLAQTALSAGGVAETRLVNIQNTVPRLLMGPGPLSTLSPLSTTIEPPTTEEQQTEPA